PLLVLWRSRLQGSFGEIFSTGLSGKDKLGPLGAGFRKADSFAGEGFGPAGIGVAEENAIHRVRRGETGLCILAGNRHVHGMAAAENADFDRVHIEFRAQLLEISEDGGGK